MAFINPQYLVETDWLEAHLKDPDLRIRMHEQAGQLRNEAGIIGAALAAKTFLVESD